jgi:hypothetical protein
MTGGWTPFTGVMDVTLAADLADPNTEIAKFGGLCAITPMVMNMTRRLRNTAVFSRIPNF